MSSAESTLFFVHCLLTANPGKPNDFNSWAAKRRYYLQNTAVVKERASRHRNSDAGRKWMREWMRKKCSDGSNYRLEKNLRTRLWFALKATKSSSARLEEKIGCSVDQFKRRIEEQWKPGWGWENWGTLWEIDHIKPCASFDLSQPEQVKECFHFSNQRPLSLFENRSKGAR